MNAGLAVFIAVVLIDLLGLLTDLGLERAGLTTITSLVRSGNWLIGGAIIGLQLFAAAGLSYHFWECR